MRASLVAVLALAVVGLGAAMVAAPSVRASAKKRTESWQTYGRTSSYYDYDLDEYVTDEVGYIVDSTSATVMRTAYDEDGNHQLVVLPRPASAPLGAAGTYVLAHFDLSVYDEVLDDDIEAVVLVNTGTGRSWYFADGVWNDIPQGDFTLEPLKAARRPLASRHPHRDRTVSRAQER